MSLRLLTLIILANKVIANRNGNNNHARDRWGREST